MNLTYEEILNYGDKIKLNNLIYNDLVTTLEWSKKFSKEDIDSAKKFLEEKDDEFLNAMTMGGIIGGVQEHIEKNLPLAISMKQNALSNNAEKNLEWFKGFIWESFLISSNPPVSNEIVDLLSDWREN